MSQGAIIAKVMVTRVNTVSTAAETTTEETVQIKTRSFPARRAPS